MIANRTPTGHKPDHFLTFSRSVSLGLASVTFLTLWQAGRGYSLFYAMTAHQPRPSPLWYVGGLLTILAAHELGHWAAAWRIGIIPAWPLLLPLPITLSAVVGAAYLPPVGTLGALTPLRMPEEPSDRWIVASSGLLAGLAAAVAVLGLGRALSPYGVALGRPLTPLLVRLLMGTGRTWHPLAVSGWIGVLMTGFNIIPLPLLDGWWIWRDLERLPERFIYGSLGFAGVAAVCLF